MPKRPWLWILVITAVVVLLAPLASRLPDGLQRVASDLGFEGRATTAPAQERAPMPGYSIPLLSSHAGLSKVLAGLAGALAVFLALKGVEALLRARDHGSRQGFRRP